MNYSEENLPPVLRAAFSTGEIALPNGASGQKLESNVSPDEAVILYSVVRALRPQSSAEIGLAQGASTVAILQAIRDNGGGLLHVMDPFQASYSNAGVAMVGAAGLESAWRFYRQFPEEVVPALPPLQFAFIDASHLFDLTLMEFVLVDKKLDVGGVIGFHDLWMPSLRKCIRYVLRNRAYKIHRPAAGPPPQRVWRQRRQSLVGKLLNAMPASRRIFSQDILLPWHSLGLGGNIAFLEKTAPDDRDWRFHQSF